MLATSRLPAAIQKVRARNLTVSSVKTQSRSISRSAEQLGDDRLCSRFFRNRQLVINDFVEPVTIALRSGSGRHRWRTCHREQQAESGQEAETADDSSRDERPAGGRLFTRNDAGLADDRNVFAFRQVVGPTRQRLNAGFRELW